MTSISSFNAVVQIPLFFCAERKLFQQCQFGDLSVAETRSTEISKTAKKNCFKNKNFSDKKKQKKVSDLN